jgi:hypothetical protein
LSGNGWTCDGVGLDKIELERMAGVHRRSGVPAPSEHFSDSVRREARPRHAL